MWQILKNRVRYTPTLLWVVGVAFLLILPSAFLLCRVPWPFTSAIRSEAPAFLESPRDVSIFPLLGTSSWSENLPAISRTVKPYFGDNKIPIALIYHALRVWGSHAPFGPNTVSPKFHGIKQDHLFIDILTNYRHYQQYSRFTIDRLLDPSPCGVRVVTAMDAGWEPNGDPRTSVNMSK